MQIRIHKERSYAELNFRAMTFGKFFEEKGSFIVWFGDKDGKCSTANEADYICADYKDEDK